MDTIFFGGGTPSLLHCSEIDNITRSLNEAFDISDNVEFTIEANPKTLSLDKLRVFMDNGVNRLSIGLQSIHDNELKKLGRIHSFEDFLSTYTMARELGIVNINIDLMYGIPDQTLISFSDALDKAINLSPEHLSVYGLILEEGTDFYKRRKLLNLPGEDAECEMYSVACNLLNNAGYNHYEISNYSKYGFESKHNLKYWECKEYLGFGLSAHSYFRGVRFSNSDKVADYINNKGRNFIELTSNDARSEFIMLSLRLSKGFSLSEYKRRFGYDFVNEHNDFLKLCVHDGLVIFKDDTISLTERGFYVSNSIIAELI